MQEFYTLGVFQFFGTAQITVESDTFIPVTVGSGEVLVTTIRAGDNVTITVTLDDGFSAFAASSNRNLGVFITSPFSFVMPQADVFWGINMTPTINFEPVDDYGLKYFFEWKTIQENDRRLEIYEKDFVGLSEERLIQNARLTYGERESDIVDTFLRSSMTFDLEAKGNDFQEFLTGDNRKFEVRYFHGSDLKFKGYILTDKITAPERRGSYIVSFQAVDGIRGFDTTRLLRQLAPFGGISALDIIISALNQTFVIPRPVNICCDIYAQGMNNAINLFEQFPVPRSAIFNDGADTLFTNQISFQNSLLLIRETLERLLNPFFVRLFLQNNEWWLIRVSDMNKSTLRFFKYGSDGVLISDITVSNIGVQNFGCGNVKFGNAVRTSELVFNQFTTVLELGALDANSEGGIIETKFNLDSWTTNTQGAFILRQWQKVRMQPVNPRSSPNTSGPIASLYYVSDSQGGYAEIWTTTSTDGLSDPNISWIELSTLNNGSNIDILEETANTISLNIEFQAQRVNTSLPLNPEGFVSLGIMVKIADNWLSFNPVGNIFTWVGSENIMLFPIQLGSRWNNLQITNVLVPKTGPLEIRIYQLVNQSIPPNRYKLLLRNFRVDVEQTEGLALAEIKARGVVDNSVFDRIFSEYRTFIGDAITANSLSAITFNSEVTTSWTDRDVGPLPLLENQAQVLANLKGRRNLRIIGTLYSDDLPDLTKSVTYDGKNFVINYLSHNSARGETEISMIEVQE